MAVQAPVATPPFISTIASESEPIPIVSNFALPQTAPASTVAPLRSFATVRNVANKRSMADEDDPVPRVKIIEIPPSKKPAKRTFPPLTPASSNLYIPCATESIFAKENPRPITRTPRAMIRRPVINVDIPSHSQTGEKSNCDPDKNPTSGHLEKDVISGISSFAKTLEEKDSEKQKNPGEHDISGDEERTEEGGDSMRQNNSLQIIRITKPSDPNRELERRPNS
jgi:hypothetical protein